MRRIERLPRRASGVASVRWAPLLHPVLRDCHGFGRTIQKTRRSGESRTGIQREISDRFDMRVSHAAGGRVNGRRLHGEVSHLPVNTGKRNSLTSFVRNAPAGVMFVPVS